MNVLGFALGLLPDEPDGPTTLTPVVDGRPLTELITDFEQAARFEPAGGYGGLVPSWYGYGDLREHFLGLEDGLPDPHDTYLLGCDCGEVGCWPLEAAIRAGEREVVWSGFVQPHRAGRDYSAFGPFTFERAQYDAAVAEVAARFPAWTPE